MSGTSGDGVDASIINSDGQNAYNVLTNKYVKYSEELSGNIHKLKNKIMIPKLKNGTILPFQRALSGP